MTLPLFDDLDRMLQYAHPPHLDALVRGGYDVDEFLQGDPLPTAVEAKQAAIAQVERNANKEWLEAFRRALEKAARRKLRFTADDIWDDFERDYPQPAQHEPRAAGAVVVKAIKDGVIVTVKNMFWNSRRKSCHNRPIQVYQSLVFKGDADA